MRSSRPTWRLQEAGGRLQADQRLPGARPRSRARSRKRAHGAGLGWCLTPVTVTKPIARVLEIRPRYGADRTSRTASFTRRILDAAILDLRTSSAEDRAALDPDTRPGTATPRSAELRGRCPRGCARRARRARPSAWRAATGPGDRSRPRSRRSAAAAAPSARAAPCACLSGCRCPGSAGGSRGGRQTNAVTAFGATAVRRLER